jgi:hypothetical protein
MKSLEQPGIFGASSSWWTMSPAAATPASAASTTRTAARAIEDGKGCCVSAISRGSNLALRLPRFFLVCFLPLQVDLWEHFFYFLGGAGLKISNHCEFCTYITNVFFFLHCCSYNRAVMSFYDAFGCGWNEVILFFIMFDSVLKEWDKEYSTVS